jgi:hypothetical protein
MDEATYLFHQTPAQLAKDLMQFVPLVESDVLIEPFRGEGAFYNSFPEQNEKLWAEIKEGRDYRDISGEYDWVISNPPFRLDLEGKRVNSFWYLVDYFTKRARKGVAFLANDTCFSAINPSRHKILEERGWGITKIVVCCIKKWRGRYFFIILEKKPSIVKYLVNNY